MHSLQFLGISIFQIIHFLRGHPGVLILFQTFPYLFLRASADAGHSVAQANVAEVTIECQSVHIGHLTLYADSSYFTP